MSKYKFTIRDFHAIKEADIILDGITVLSGVNGCGKSTLSRWLYYIIEGTENFNSFLFDEYKKTVINNINRIQMAALDLNRQPSYTSDIDLSEKLTEAYNKIIQTDSCTEENIKAIANVFAYSLSLIEITLENAIESGLQKNKIDRIYNYLNINPGHDSSIENIKNNYSRYIDELSTKLGKNIKERPKDIFYKTIQNHFDLQDDMPGYIQLQEDGVDILEDSHVSTLFNLRNALYIDTPMAIETNSSDNIFWNALRKIMLDDSHGRKYSDKEKKIKLRIKDLLKGETIIEKDELFDKNKLRFVSNDNKINISLKDTATGFKTFSYLQRLLEKGLLCDESILMIDEPEAHLHPQWIVEYARLLVMLNKELGLKIMIASHNPDMITAIHDIANKEGVLDNTNFYVAQQDSTNRHQYIFKDLQHGIEEIFESFNIALDNISRYGSIDIQ